MSNDHRAGPDLPRYALRLFVAGTSPRSLRTIENLDRICAVYLVGRLDLEIVDIYQQPELADRDQVIAAPTLFKHLPAPPCRIIGDLADEQAVLTALGLREPSSVADGR